MSRKPHLNRNPSYSYRRAMLGAARRRRSGMWVSASGMCVSAAHSLILWWMCDAHHHTGVQAGTAIPVGVTLGGPDYL